MQIVRPPSPEISREMHRTALSERTLFVGGLAMFIDELLVMAPSIDGGRFSR